MNKVYELRLLNCAVQAARRYAAKVNGGTTHGMSMEDCNEIISAHFIVGVPKNKKQYRPFYAELYLQGKLGVMKKEFIGVKYDPAKVQETRRFVDKKFGGKKKGKDKKEPKGIKAQPWYDPNSFYCQPKWLLVRNRTKKLYPRKCMKCEATDTKMHVDHIKPRSKYPHLEYEMSNLQILCKNCNMEKSNLDETDYRPDWAKNHNFTNGLPPKPKRKPPLLPE